jgi:hypothetical protein
MKKIFIISFAALIAAGLLTETTFAGVKGAGKAAPTTVEGSNAPGPEGGARPRGGGRRGRRREWIKRFDTDGDGKLSEEEKAKMEEARKERLAKMDKDGDGEISPEEREQARKHRRRRVRREGEGEMKKKHVE